MSQRGQGSGPTKATGAKRPIGQPGGNEFSLARVYREHLGRDPRRERLFLASLGFFGGFGLLSVGIWGGPFFIGVGRELRKLVR
jgi:hypothetical protein